MKVKDERVEDVRTEEDGGRMKGEWEMEGKQKKRLIFLYKNTKY